MGWLAAKIWMVPKHSGPKNVNVSWALEDKAVAHIYLSTCLVLALCSSGTSLCSSQGGANVGRSDETRVPQSPILADSPVTALVILSLFRPIINPIINGTEYRRCS